MAEECNAFLANKTWSLVPKKGMNVLGCKSVYRVKQKADGKPCKVRLVAKGFHQQRGIDFD